MERASRSTFDSIVDRWPLIVGDAVTLVLFATIGRASHEEGLTVIGIVETAAPFVLGWVVVAPFTGAYSRDATAGLKKAMKVAARTWIVALPLGLLFRALYLRREIPVSFAIVALLTTLILLSLWRAGATIAHNLQSSR